MIEVKGYHAHVYYVQDTRTAASALRDAVTKDFEVEPGELHDDPVGPHPTSQFVFKFRAEEFGRVVPWLMLNRAGLAVLIHPLTDSSYDDHSKHALWLGEPVAVRLDVLRPAYTADLLLSDRNPSRA